MAQQIVRPELQHVAGKLAIVEIQSNDRQACPAIEVLVLFGTCYQRWKLITNAGGLLHCTNELTRKSRRDRIQLCQ